MIVVNTWDRVWLSLYVIAVLSSSKDKGRRESNGISVCQSYSVLGEKEGKVRNKETAELLDYGFNLYEVTTIKQKGEELGTISLDKANLEKVKIIANQDVTVLKKQSEKKKEYKSNVVLNTLKLPIYKGDVIGKLIVKDDLGNMIEEVKITVSEDLKKDNYFNIFMKILKGMITGDLF